jgi:hypothetical protein
MVMLHRPEPPRADGRFLRRSAARILSATRQDRTAISPSRHRLETRGGRSMWVRHIEPNAHCQCHHNRSGEPKRHNLTLANITEPHFNHTTLSLLHLGSIHSTSLDLRFAVVDLIVRYRTAPYANPRSCVRSKTSSRPVRVSRRTQGGGGGGAVARLRSLSSSSKSAVDQIGSIKRKNLNYF